MTTIMKKILYTFGLIASCFLLLSVKPVFGQESEEYSIILKPPSGQQLETDWDRKRILLSAHGLSIGITANAYAYETNFYPYDRENNSDTTENRPSDLEKKLVLYDVNATMMLTTENENVCVFTDNVGIAFSNEIHKPQSTAIKYYSLPSDTTSIFVADNPYNAEFPYDISLVYPRFEQELSSDTLNVDLYLPAIRTPEGKQLMENRVIKLQGVIQRN